MLSFPSPLYTNTSQEIMDTFNFQYALTKILTRIRQI
jgi:hypothetical protein